MMNQEQWRKSAQGVFNNIILIMLCSILGGIFSTIGNAQDAIGFVQSFSGNGDFDMGWSGMDILEIGCTIAVVVGYFMYLSNLLAFAKVQTNEEDSLAVRRIRSGLIWSIVAILTDLIAGWLSFIFFIVAFFVLIGGYSRLKHSVTFPKKARRGAGTLYASMIVELVGNILDLIPLAGDVLELIFSIIAFCMLLAGWAKIKNADVTEVSTPVMNIYGGGAVVNVTVTPELKAKVATKTDEELKEILQHQNEYSIALVEAAKIERENRMTPVIQQPVQTEPAEKVQPKEVVNTEKVKQEEKKMNPSAESTIPLSDKMKELAQKVDKKYAIGGVAAIVLCIIGISMCGGGSGVDFEVQLPAWKKFVVVGDNVNLRKAPDANSPRLMEEQGEMDSQFVWENEMNTYDMPRSPFRVRNNVACPVLSETEEWYEIRVQMGWGYDDAFTETVYVMKKFCKEVVPQSASNPYFYKIPKGKYKGKYLYYDRGGMYAMPSSMTLGWEIDGGYVFPRSFKHEFANDGGSEEYDFSQLTDDMLEEWFGEKIKNPIQEYHLYYNFPGVGLNWYCIAL